MSTTDRDLLERAAKAAGLYTCDPRGDDSLWCEDNRDEDGNEAEPRCGMQTIGGVWNPLVDDAAALRLAVKLGLQVLPYPIFEEPKHSVIVKKRYWDSDAERSREHAATLEVYDGEPEAATRRAIVRAAAELTA